MRGSPRPDPALLVSLNMKWAYAAMVGVSTVRISEARGVNIAYWRSQFCEYAMRGSPGPHPVLHIFTNAKCSHAAMVDMPT